MYGSSGLRRDRVSPAIHTCYEEYLHTLDDDPDDNKHKNHLIKIGKACALFWKVIIRKVMLIVITCNQSTVSFPCSLLSMFELIISY